MSRDRTLFIHLGPAKTGTSALQDLMRNHPPEGLYYPQTGQWNDGAHHRLIVALDGKTELNGEPLAPFDDQLADLEREIESVSDDVLLSSEGIRPTKTLSTLLDALTPLKSRAFEKIELIYTVRHPLERAASGYNQAVKDSYRGLSDSPAAYLATCPQVYALAAPIKAIKAFGLETHLVDYSPNVVHDILSIISSNSVKATINPYANRSFGKHALLAHYLVNNLFSSAKERVAAVRHIRQSEDIRFKDDSELTFFRPEIDLYTKTVVEPDRMSLRSMGIDYPITTLKPNDRETSEEVRAAAYLSDYFKTAFDTNPEEVRDLTVKFFSPSI